MGLNKTSIIAIIIALAVLAGEFFLVFAGTANPGNAVLNMVITIVNGVIMAFALLLLFIGIMLLSS
jgi:hypothetical protein